MSGAGQEAEAHGFAPFQASVIGSLAISVRWRGRGKGAEIPEIST
jgi:hypothetical protein